MSKWDGLIAKWWDWYGDKVILFLLMAAAAILVFEAGVMKGMAREVAPITIEIPRSDVAVPTATLGVSIDAEAQGKQSPLTPSADCLFVGSKNSNLYHIPTCAPAKRIKPENRVCFASVEQATARGYKPGCLK